MMLSHDQKEVHAQLLDEFTEQRDRNTIAKGVVLPSCVVLNRFAETRAKERQRTELRDIVIALFREGLVDLRMSTDEGTGLIVTDVKAS
jgi:hypothetical protein